jgi:penicillin-binding protein 1A
MENMTGGTLPAQSWHEIMVYALQGLEPKPPYGVAPAPPAAPGQIAAASAAKSGAGIVEVGPREIGLAPKATQIILEIGDLARSARKHSAALDAPVPQAAEANAGVTVVHGGVMAP